MCIVNKVVVLFYTFHRGKGFRLDKIQCLKLEQLSSVHSLCTYNVRCTYQVKSMCTVRIVVGSHFILSFSLSVFTCISEILIICIFYDQNRKYIHSHEKKNVQCICASPYRIETLSSSFIYIDVGYGIQRRPHFHEYMKQFLLFFIIIIPTLHEKLMKMLQLVGSIRLCFGRSVFCD